MYQQYHDNMLKSIIQTLVMLLLGLVSIPVGWLLAILTYRGVGHIIQAVNYDKQKYLLRKLEDINKSLDDREKLLLSQLREVTNPDLKYRMQNKLLEIKHKRRLLINLRDLGFDRYQRGSWPGHALMYLMTDQELASYAQYVTANNCQYFTRRVKTAAAVHSRRTGGYSARTSYSSSAAATTAKAR